MINPNHNPNTNHNPNPNPNRLTAAPLQHGSDIESIMCPSGLQKVNTEGYTLQPIDLTSSDEGCV